MTANFATDRFKSVILVAVLAGLGANLAFLLYSLPLPILDQHAFRQTQTAVTAYWLVHDPGDILRYETPVLGHPWSVPMEFPVYQLMVAALVSLTGINLDVAGRVVTFAFHLSTVLTVYATTRRLKLDRRFAAIFAALYLASPLYIFWGRSFMIETCAVFFGTLFIYFVSCFASEAEPVRRWGLYFPAALLSGSICALAKVTTYPGFAAAAVLVVLLQRRWRQTCLAELPLLAATALLAAGPLVPAYAWVVFSDQVKGLNPAGRELTSAALHEWNFGTLQQRLTWKFWEVVLVRGVRDTIGYHIGFVGLLWACWRIRPAARLTAGALFGLYLLPMLVFANLHFWHNYYQVANAVFLILAAAVVVYSLQLDGRIKSAAWLLAIIVGVQLITFANGFFRSTQAVAVRPHKAAVIGEFLRQHTPPESAIIVFGFDWSGEIAYYSQRKSLTVPVWYTYNKVLAQLTTGGSRLGGLPVAAIVDANNTHASIRQRGQQDIFAGYRAVPLENCTIYYRDIRQP